MSRRPRPRRKERKANLRDLSAPVREIVLEVFSDHDGARLDQFISDHFPWRSKNALQAWIASGQVQIRGRADCKKSSRLRGGAEVVVSMPEPNEEIRHAELAGELVVLHEDQDLLALDKPPGLIVHPVGKVRYNTLVQALHWHYRHGAGQATQPGVVPKICHRLDKDTSGVMIVAKNDPARRRIQESFERRALTKEYFALLCGNVVLDAQDIDRPIGPDPSGDHGLKMAVRPDGLAALSHVRVLERFASVTCCAIRIDTGRQHQIRVHSASIGHPVVSDQLYGSPTDASSALGLDRQALHAWRLTLPHPRDGRPLTLEAPVPDDIARALATLR